MSEKELENQQANCSISFSLHFILLVSLSLYVSFSRELIPWFLYLCVSHSLVLCFTLTLILSVSPFSLLV